MKKSQDDAAEPGRRRFIKLAAAASLMTAMESHNPVAYSESDGHRKFDMNRKILMNGKFATLDLTV